MSKLFSSKKYFLKPIKQSNNNDYINKSMQNLIDPYSKSNQGITNNFSSFNKNNITVDYPRHYSPPGRSVQSLPPISNKIRKTNNSQKKSVKTLSNSNSSKNLYSQSLFGPPNKKSFEREKTQIDILENNFDPNKNNLNRIEELDDIDTGTNLNKLKNNITQINNITNINIHIYQGNSGLNPTQDKEIENIKKNEIIPKNSPIITEFKNFQNDAQNLISNNNINNKNIISPSLIGNAGLSIMNSNPKVNPKKANNIFTINPDKNKKSIQGNIKILPSNNSLYTNKSSNNSSLSSIGAMIMNNSSNNNNVKINKVTPRGLSQNKNGNSRYVGNNSLPEINKGRSISINKKGVGLENNLNNLLRGEINIK